MQERDHVTRPVPVAARCIDRRCRRASASAPWNRCGRPRPGSRARKARRRSRRSPSMTDQDGTENTRRAVRRDGRTRPASGVRRGAAVAVRHGAVDQPLFTSSGRTPCLGRDDLVRPVIGASGPSWPLVQHLGVPEGDVDRAALRRVQVVAEQDRLGAAAVRHIAARVCVVGARGLLVAAPVAVGVDAARVARLRLRRRIGAQVVRGEAARRCCHREVAVAAERASDSSACLCSGVSPWPGRTSQMSSAPVPVAV